MAKLINMLDQTGERFAVVQRLNAKDKRENGGEDLYLNHAYMYNYTFGAKNMAWYGTASAALKHLNGCKVKFKGQRLRLAVVEFNEGEQYLRNGGEA